MSEITRDSPLDSASGRPQPAHQDISQWAERYALMAGILTPEKAPALFAYLGIIIRAERNYQTGAWVAYDRQ